MPTLKCADDYNHPCSPRCSAGSYWGTAGAALDLKAWGIGKARGEPPLAPWLYISSLTATCLSCMGYRNFQISRFCISTRSCSKRSTSAFYIPALRMTSTTPDQFQELLAQLNEVAKGYSTSPDVNGMKSRVAIVEKAKGIMQAMMDPSDMGMHHLVNVSMHLLHAVGVMRSLTTNY